MSFKIEIEKLSVKYGQFAVISDFSLNIPEGQIVTIYGPSGCGKSTVIKALLGQLAYSGQILMNGQPASQYTHPIGYVPQDNDLLPWKSVKGNIELWNKQNGLRDGLSVNEVLQLVGLPDAGEKQPSALSGGMQRRAVLARAMATNSEIFLFDEALISIERNLRRDILVHLRHYIKSNNLTCIAISHDPDEAVFLSDRLIKLSANPTVVIKDLKSGLPNERDISLFDKPEYSKELMELVTGV